MDVNAELIDQFGLDVEQSQRNNVATRFERFQRLQRIHCDLILRYVKTVSDTSWCVGENLTRGWWIR